MNTDNITAIKIMRKAVGRFDKRLTIGPACWSHYDLLWIHEGSVILYIGNNRQTITIEAPAGILICPNVPFSGRSKSPSAIASICHFTMYEKECAKEHDDNTHYLINGSNAYAIQHMVKLLNQDLGTNSTASNRLLHSLLDLCTHTPPRVQTERLQVAWLYAEQNLDKIRTLQDVASTIGLSESAFRMLHRDHHPISAGQHLKGLRLRRAEYLLITTRHSIAEVARSVGYTHIESFCTAFKKFYKQTPARYRASNKWFA